MTNRNGAGSELEPSVGAGIMDRLDHMAEISESGDILTRRCYTREHRQINDLAGKWMREAGMAVREDPVGNMIGRYEGRKPNAPAIILGSHLDTVINAGRYDGSLGVLSAIDCVRSLNERGIRFDDAVEVACFADEEGVRFQSTYLGSRGMAGCFDQSLLNRKDSDGISLSEAMISFGLDPAHLKNAARDPSDVRCYLELHIEQGPVLEREQLPVCAVTAIAGASRMMVSMLGEAGHAGTVPMNTRQDALAAACECVLLVEDTAKRYDQAVGTVGQIAAFPGATNEIPGVASFSVDFRSSLDSVRQTAVSELQRDMSEIAERRDVDILIDKTHDADGATCSDWIIEQIEGAMTDLGHRPFRLASGAGHDAAAMASITDIGMIFVRCRGGISHSPEEAITREDAITGADLLLRTLERIGGAKN
ncbi:MAG: allantoate amidohydrolase [Albidovulum sp.]|nr:allantoate amidohydrolase [Albidovulum sp.]